MTWLAIGAMAVAAVGTAMTAYNSYETNKYQAAQAEADADAAKSQGRVEAERIRKEKQKAMSAARAAAAENGLNVDMGTAVTINDAINQAGNYDAAMAEISGFNSSQRLKGEASVYRRNAGTALATGAVNTVSSGMNAYGTAGGWK